LFYVDISLALAVLVFLFSVAGRFVADHSASVLKIKIKKSPTTSFGATAAQKLLSLDNQTAVETSRRLMVGYQEDFEAARLLISSLPANPNSQLTNTLIELSLQRENTAIQHLAVSALRHVRQNEGSLKAFLQLSGDPDPVLASAAAWVLAKAGHRPALSYLMQSGAPDAEIERLAHPSSSVNSQLSSGSYDEILDHFRDSKLSEVDALKLCMFLLRNADKYPTGLVDSLFQLRNQGAYLALAQSLDEGLLLDTETLRSLARMGYAQVAGRLTDDLLRFGWQSQSFRAGAEQEVQAAKSALEELLKDSGVQISLPHLQKIAVIDDFYVWADSPVRVQLDGIREQASALNPRHIEFWKTQGPGAQLVVRPKSESAKKAVSNVETVLAGELYALTPANRAGNNNGFSIQDLLHGPEHRNGSVEIPACKARRKEPGEGDTKRHPNFSQDDGKASLATASKPMTPKRNRLERFFYPDRSEKRRVARVATSDLVAYFWTGGPPQSQAVRDISESGMYVVTEERWYLGTKIRITLAKKSMGKSQAERSVTLFATAVRWGANGVGLEFVKNAAEDRRLM
jgi:hypothetical protein